MTSVAVLPARGIGDALLMMIAAHQCQQAGYRSVLYHTPLCELSGWFPEDVIEPFLARGKALTCDLIIAENDNSAYIHYLLNHHRSQLSLWYPSYKQSKHAPLAPQDYIFNPQLSMADNSALALAQLIGCAPSTNNGITPPVTLTHRAQSQRVIIHPTSSSTDKMWGLSRYIQLGKRLAAVGFEPLFVVPESEKHLDLPSVTVTPTLADLATLVYESGYAIGNDSLLGHLASNLAIPTLILARSEAHMQLWRPGWHPGRILLPPSWVPTTYWKQGIRPKRALKAFKQLAGCYPS